MTAMKDCSAATCMSGQRIPLAGVAHQNGTIRFGHDPKTSALDVNCKAHDLENLYVVDGSFFPSSAAVNPALTIMANALRVGDHILERLGTSVAERAGGGQCFVGSSSAGWVWHGCYWQPSRPRSPANWGLRAGMHCKSDRWS